MTEPGVRATLQCQVSGEAARFALRLTSIVPEPVLVSVQCTYPETHSALLPDDIVKTPRGLAATRPWSFFEAPDGLALWFARLPLPPGVEAYAPFLPLYARLHEGESRTVDFSLPVPVVELDPYFDPPILDRTTQTEARRLTVLCDCIAVAETAWIDRGPHGLVFCSGRQFTPVAMTTELPGGLLVRRREDPFHRPTVPKRA